MNNSKLCRITTLIVSGLILIGGCSLFVLEKLHVIDLYKKPIKVETIPSSDSQTTTPIETRQIDANDTVKSQGTNTHKDYFVASNISASELVTPYGSFISNHEPGANETPTTVLSTCITTPGAICYIQFLNNGVIKKLDPKKTNIEGIASWYWDVEEAGLSSGVWQITAYASLNNQVKSTTDQRSLTVK